MGGGEKGAADSGNPLAPGVFHAQTAPSQDPVQQHDVAAYARPTPAAERYNDARHAEYVSNLIERVTRLQTGYHTLQAYVHGKQMARAEKCNEFLAHVLPTARQIRPFNNDPSILQKVTSAPYYRHVRPRERNYAITNVKWTGAHLYGDVHYDPSTYTVIRKDTTTTSLAPPYYEKYELIPLRAVQ